MGDGLCGMLIITDLVLPQQSHEPQQKRTLRSKTIQIKPTNKQEKIKILRIEIHAASL